MGEVGRVCLGFCGTRGSVSGLLCEENSDVHALPLGGREPLADAGLHAGVAGVDAVGINATARAVRL